MGLIILLGICILPGLLVYAISKGAINALTGTNRRPSPHETTFHYYEAPKELTPEQKAKIESQIMDGRRLAVLQEMDRIVELEKRGEITPETRDKILNTVFDSPHWEEIKKSAPWRF